MENPYQPHADEFERMCELIAGVVSKHPAVKKIVMSRSAMMDDMNNTQLILVCDNVTFASHLDACRKNVRYSGPGPSKDKLARQIVGFPSEHESETTIVQYLQENGVVDNEFGDWYASELTRDVEFVIAPQEPLRFIQQMLTAVVEVEDRERLWLDYDVLKLLVDLQIGRVFDSTTGKFVPPTD